METITLLPEAASAENYGASGLETLRPIKFQRPFFWFKAHQLYLCLKTPNIDSRLTPGDSDRYLRKSKQAMLSQNRARILKERLHSVHPEVFERALGQTTFRVQRQNKKQSVKS